MRPMTRFLLWVALALNLVWLAGEAKAGLGPELITGGAFTDADSTSWTQFGGDNVAFTGTAVSLTSNGCGVYQTGTWTVGKTYRITYTVVSNTYNGTLSMGANNSFTLVMDKSAGVHSYDSICLISGSNAAFILGGGGTGILVLDNVSVREVATPRINGKPKQMRVAP